MDFYEAVAARKSVRAYKPDPLPDDVVDRVLEAARLAPSAKNIQPWRFIIVRNPQVIEALAGACKNPRNMAGAPIVICGCVLEEICYQHMGGYWNSWAVDAAIALEHIMLAAAAEGLGTCWIGAFREAEVRRILGIPERVKIVALTPLGRPAQAVSAQPRKPRSEIVCSDHWSF